MKYHLINNTSIIKTPGNSIIPPFTSTIIAKADTGASQHYFRNQDTPALKNLQAISFGPVVNLQDSTPIQARQKGHISLHPSLSEHAPLMFLIISRMRPSYLLVNHVTMIV